MRHVASRTCTPLSAPAQRLTTWFATYHAVVLLQYASQQLQGSLVDGTILAASKAQLAEDDVAPEGAPADLEDAPGAGSGS